MSHKHRKDLAAAYIADMVNKHGTKAAARKLRISKSTISRRLREAGYQIRTTYVISELGRAALDSGLIPASEHDTQQSA